MLLPVQVTSDNAAYANWPIEQDISDIEELGQKVGAYHAIRVMANASLYPPTK